MFFSFFMLGLCYANEKEKNIRQLSIIMQSHTSCQNLLLLIGQCLQVGNLFNSLKKIYTHYLLLYTHILKKNHYICGSICHIIQTFSMRYFLLLVCTAFLLFSNGLFAQGSDCSTLSAGTYSSCDNFSDSDFSTNPAWQGNSDQFIVNTNQQLQLNSAAADTSYLSTAISMGKEWRLYFKMPFAPSDNNRLRYYLASDQSDLTTPLNGYFLLIGENGSADPLQLYRQDGNTLSLLASGNAGTVANNPDMTLKVTRDNSGNWTVYTGSVLGTDFNLDLQATDNTYSTTNFAGVWCKYTSSNINKFYFDNFYVGDPLVDNTPPTVISQEILDNTTLQVCFSEIVSAIEGENPDNYVLNGSIHPTTVIVDASETCYTLTFATPFGQGNNTLQISNLQDSNGNTMLPYGGNFVIYTPQNGDVIINELFADPTPSVGLPEYEFVELYNTRNFPITLTNWHLSDDYPNSNGGTILDLVIPANGYAVICPTGTALTAYQALSLGALAGVTSFPSLNNTGETITLADPDGVFINAVTYSDAWYNDSEKKDGGYTLELIDYTIPCNGAANWSASMATIGGTPGAQNSIFQQPTDTTPPFLLGATISSSNAVTLAFSEALNNPDNAIISFNNNISVVDVSDEGNGQLLLTLDNDLQAGTIYTITVVGAADCLNNIANTQTAQIALPQPSGVFDVLISEIFADPDAPAEYDLPTMTLIREKYVEVYNRSNKVISLEGWQFRDGADTSFLEQYSLLPQGRVLLCATSSASLFAAAGIPALGVSSFPEPNTTSDFLSLVNEQGIIIHTVNYDNTWYRNEIKAKGGWTLEMIDPNNPCAGAENWRASENPTGGTPAAQNSVNGTQADTALPQIIHAEVATTTSVWLFFNESLDRSTASNISNYTIDNGVQIATANAIAPEFKTVVLELTAPLNEGTIYNIQIGQVTDCVGNATGMYNTAPFGIASTPEVGELVINEILFDPTTGGYDYVELYNNSNKVLSLGFRFFANVDVDSSALVWNEILPVSNELYSILPQQYLAFTENPDFVRQHYGACNNSIPYNGIIQTALPSYSSVGVVGLIDLFGNIVDGVLYDENMHNPLLDDTDGVSLERISANEASDKRSNWQSAAASFCYGTPGYRNSQSFEGAGDGSEITVEPAVFSPNSDGNADFTTIHYQFDQPNYTVNVTVYDERGRTIKRIENNETTSTEGFFVWDGSTDDNRKAPIGIYVVYIQAYNADGLSKSFKKTVTVAGRLD